MVNDYNGVGLKQSLHRFFICGVPPLPRRADGYQNFHLGGMADGMEINWEFAEMFISLPC